MRAERLHKRTPRDLVEELLLEHFSANLRPSGQRRTDPKPLRGENIFSESTNFPGGLVYKCKGAIFGIDISFRLNNPVIPCIRIVTPRGDRWRETVDSFASRLLDVIPEAELIVDSGTYKVTY